MILDVGLVEHKQEIQQRDFHCVQLRCGLSHKAQNSAAVPAHSETLVELCTLMMDRQQGALTILPTPRLWLKIH